MIVANYVGPHADYAGDPAAQLLRTMIRRHLRLGYAVYLDFTGVEMMTSAFLNGVVFDLYADYPEAEWPDIDDRLTALNLTEIHEAIWLGAQHRAQRYYRDPVRGAQIERECAGIED